MVPPPPLISSLEEWDPDIGDRPLYWQQKLWSDIEAEWSTCAGSLNDQILQLSVILAWLEWTSRNGTIHPTLKESLEKEEPLQDLVKHIESKIIDDLRALSANYLATQYAQWYSKPAVLNPTFKGSLYVKGADADWIVETTLWDMKTTKNPSKNLSTDLKQILGYALLDFDNEYKIDSVGLYYPRFSQTLSWSVVDLLEQLTWKSKPLDWWRRLLSETLR